MVVLQLNITVILHQTITGTPHAQVTANHSKYTQATTSAHIQHISNAYGCAEWPRQGPPSHLTRETISGRRPADGADTPGGVFRPGDNLPLGRRRRYSLRTPLESIADLRGPVELSSRYAPYVAYPSQNPDVRISRIRLFIRFIVRQFKRIYSHRF